MININNNLTSPVRKIEGKVGLFLNGSTASITDNIINLTDVSLMNRKASVDKEVVCLGKNLIDYKTVEWLGGDSFVLEGDEITAEVTNNTINTKLYPTDHKWIKSGSKYTFSLQPLSYGDSPYSHLVMEMTVAYTDGTYTTQNNRYTNCDIQGLTIATDATKEIEYIELKPIKCIGEQRLIAAIQNIQLSISNDINYQEYQEPVTSVNGEIELFAPTSTVYTTDGSMVNLTYHTCLVEFKHTDALKSINIERVGESKFFGFGICQKANIHLIDKDRLLDITTANGFNIYFDNVCNYPNFYVTEVHRDENTNELSITAYDKIYAAASHTVAELGLVTPYTISGVANACAALLGLNAVNIIGITEENSPFDREYIEEANFEGTETIRAALNAIAEATQTIYYIDKDENLVFKRIDVEGAAILTIGKEDYITLNSKTNRRLSAICSATQLGDNVIASLDQTGSTQYVRDNPFWENQEDIDVLVENALAAIGGLTINQFDCAWRGNYALEPGDKINFITKNNKVITSFLLDDVISYEGFFNETSQWSYEDNEGESVDNPSTLGEALKYTFAKVDKVNKEIELVVSEVDGYTESISNIQMTTNNITATVGDLNKDVGELSEKVNATLTSEDVQIAIQQELNNGVEKVVTTTGFVFNDEGLKVSKTGSEMTTLITEDGMTVNRDSGEVLTADNTGVKAENLTATTYLIVGINSRFENYDNGSRTGCFWIGG